METERRWDVGEMVVVHTLNDLVGEVTKRSLNGDGEYDMDDEHYFDVYVRHDSEWTIYTDSGFERAISDAIGHEVRWSEQGMQEDGMAHLEA